MDRARKRFRDNVALLEAHNPKLAVMGDRSWTDACTNQYICHMAKKLWMYDYTPTEVVQLEKAVLGYLEITARRAEAQPVQPGGRVIKGEIFSVKQSCKHDGDPCEKHWYMNVRDADQKNTIYTPIPLEVLDVSMPQNLVGSTASFYAYITVSSRDETFGFAHHPKLMTITKEKDNAS
jgi:hypothetical protein